MIDYIPEKEYENILKTRNGMGHKYNFGRAGLVCGSKHYQGAACFAVSAALHSGVGLAVAFIPDCIYIPFASKISGAVIEPLDCEDGMICDRTLPSKILARKCNALLCGSGLGLSDASAATLLSVCQLEIPLVLDGDALTIAASDKSVFFRTTDTVITPHIGEFARLTGYKEKYVKENMASASAEFAQKYGCTVVLKDYITVIADKEGNTALFSHPTTALAKGGSGDVLAGMLVSFLAQGYSAAEASRIAVTLHNACGHKCEKQFGAYYVQPENIISSITGLI